MPCTAKKFEAQRPELAANGYPDVDVVITTRELARMIKEAGINFLALPDESFDDPLGVSTGAGVIFGVTGGVMEAALRTVAEILTGEELENIEFGVVRGLEGIRTASIDVGGVTIKAAVANGTANAAALLDRIKSGQEHYDFIEIMGCPGGCINGGGQPILTAQQRWDIDIKAERAKALYQEDRDMPIRKSHENPQIKAIYNEFLGKPNSHTAHELLHTHYTERLKYC
ncbi:MAG: NAD(P)-dependent iron-only hydrogenase catalytic subunit [Mahella sp.]|nr:NAD(P)-dependent iron-only hydrogenase catalytic subunit [Mahella sp.]